MSPLRTARKAKGLSRRRLSELTGIHDRQLSDYERGRYRPTGERLEKLAQVLNVEPRTIGDPFRGSSGRPRPRRTIREIPDEVREKEILELEAWPETSSVGIPQPLERPESTGKIYSKTLWWGPLWPRTPSTLPSAPIWKGTLTER